MGRLYNRKPSNLEVSIRLAISSLLNKTRFLAVIYSPIPLSKLQEPINETYFPKKRFTIVANREPVTSIKLNVPKPSHFKATIDLIKRHVNWAINAFLLNYKIVNGFHIRPIDGPALRIKIFYFTYTIKIFVNETAPND